MLAQQEHKAPQVLMAGKPAQPVYRVRKARKVQQASTVPQAQLA